MVSLILALLAALPVVDAQQVARVPRMIERRLPNWKLRNRIDEVLAEAKDLYVQAG